MIDSFLQELHRWNLEEFKNFLVFGLLFAIFAAVVLKLGLLFFSIKSYSSRSRLVVIDSIFVSQIS
jgi:hypothetical protein